MSGKNMKNIVFVDGYYSSGLRYPIALKAIDKKISSVLLISNKTLYLKYTNSKLRNEIKNKYQMVLFLEDEKSIDMLKKLKVLAVIPCSDFSLKVSANLSRILKLKNFNKVEDVEILSNKYLVQEKLKKSGIKTIDYYASNDVEKILAWQNGRKIVLKPFSDTGSNLFFVCSSRNEVINAFNKIKNSKTLFDFTNNKVFAQEFVMADEYAVNFVSNNGVHKLDSIFKYNKLQKNGTKYYDLTFLVKKDFDILKPLIEKTKKILDVLGIKFGASHCECFYSEGAEPLLIECNARIMGNIMPSVHLHKSIGHNPLGHSIISYIKKEKFNQIKFNIPKKDFVLKTFISNGEKKNGKILEKIQKYFKTIVSIDDNFDSNLVKYYPKTINTATIPGQCILTGSEKDVKYEIYAFKIIDLFYPNLIFANKNYIPNKFEKQFLLSLSKRESLDKYLKQHTHSFEHFEENKLWKKHFLCSFKESVKKQPNNLCINYPLHHFKATYKQVWNITDNLTKQLKLAGVKKGDVVGMYLPRTEWLSLSLISILKAYGVFLMLDTTLPVQRIEYMVKNANCKFIVCFDGVGNFSSKTCKKIFILPDKLLQNKDKAPNLKSFNEQLLNYYDPFAIHFTSGSTGSPKGTILSGATISSCALGFFNNEKQGFSSDIKSYTTIAPQTFIGVINDTIVSLTEGWSLNYVDLSELHSIDSICNYIKTNNITFSVIPGPFVKQFIKQYSSTSLHYIGTSGCIVKFDDPLPKIPLFNIYGLTEVCGKLLSGNVNPKNGKNLSNHYDYVNVNNGVYIINEENKICKPNEVGQLCVVGPILSKGYINNADNLKSYDLNPFYCSYLDDEIYLKMFKTGDLAKYTNDGHIQIYGREDLQVKINGIRIEITEVENAINNINNVKKSCVVAKERTNGDKYLVALIESDLPMDEINIRQELQKKLPYYMIPLFFKQTKIPLTVTGKIDRHSCSKIELNFTTTSSFDDQTSKMLYKIWNEVIGIKNIKINSNSSFFNVGGDSLTATYLAAKICKQWNLDIQPIEIYKRPIFKEQVELINQKWQSTEIITLLNEHTYSKQYIPLIIFHTANAGIEIYKNLLAKLNPKILVLCVNNVNLINDSKIGSINEMANIYADEINKKLSLLNIKSSINLLGWSFGGNLALEANKNIKNKINHIFLIDPMNFSKNDKAIINKVMNEKNMREYLENQKIFSGDKNKALLANMMFNQNMLNSYSLNDKILVPSTLFKSTDFFNTKLMFNLKMQDKNTLVDLSNSKKCNGYEKIIKNLNVIQCDCQHDDCLYDETLPKILNEINKNEKY